MDGWNIVLNILNIIVLIGIGLFLKSYLPSYFEQKGKNLATKEDVEEITERTERARRREQRKEEKINKVNEQLDRFAELAELYAFFARTEAHVVKDGSGEFIKDEDGKPIIEKHSLEPEARFEQAIEALTGSDFRGAIARKIFEIRLNSGNAINIASELDPSGGLNKKFQELYWQTVNSIEFSIKHESFERMVSSLREARKTRGEIYSMLQAYRDSEQ
jgi:predicted nuclease with TOPRIM domain